MTKRSPKRVQQILRKAPSLKHLLREADADHNRLIQLRQILPAELASHCIDTHLRNGRLVIYVNSPVWASRLRLMTPKIQESFQARQVICRVQSPQAVKKPDNTPRATARHSDKAADLIESSASQYSDPEIRSVLSRIAKAVRPKR